MSYPPQQPYDAPQYGPEYGAITPYSGGPYAPGPYSPPPVMHPPKSGGAAVALELIPGIFGVFGIGNMYAGRVGLGIVLMVSYWVLFWINVVLAFVLIGWVTGPLTWIGFMIGGALLAAHATERYNRGA